MMHNLKSEIRAGFILSYVSMSVSILLGLAVTPYILKMLGQNEYGLYSLIGSLVGYISLFDLGVGTTTLRYVSRYRVEGNKQKLESFVATCFVIYIVIGVIVLIIGAILYKYLDVIFASSLDASQIGKARTMFAILIGNLGVSFFGCVYPAIMKAYEKFTIFQKIVIAKNLVRTLVVVVLLSLGFDSLGIVIADASLNILITIIQFIYVRFALKVHTAPWKWEIGSVKEIFSFSSFVFLSVLINQVNLRMGTFILGIFSNTAQIANYALGMTLATYYTQLSGALSGIFMPRLTQMTANNRPMHEVEDVLIRVSRFQVKLLALIIIGFISVGEQFIILWAGEDYKQTYKVLILMMIAYYLPYTQTTLNTLAQVLNKHKTRNCIYGATAVANIILMCILAMQCGALGAAISTCISMLIGYGVFIQMYYKKGMGVNMLRYLKETYLDTFPAAVLGLGAGIIVNRFSDGYWLYILFNITTIIVVYVIAIWFFGSSPYEKEQVRKILNGLKRSRSETHY